MQMKRQVFGPVFFVFIGPIIEGSVMPNRKGFLRMPAKKIKKISKKGLTLLKKSL